MQLEEPVQAMASPVKQNSFQKKIEQEVKCVMAIEADSDGRAMLRLTRPTSEHATADRL